MSESRRTVVGEPYKASLLVLYLDGDAPVQAWGTINGYPFYFRARGAGWQFAVSNLRGDYRQAVRVAAGEQPGFVMERRYGRHPHDASVISYSLVMTIIRRAARAFLAFSARVN